MGAGAQLVETIDQVLKAIEGDATWTRPSFNALRTSIGATDGIRNGRQQVFTTAELDRRMRSLEAAEPGNEPAFDIYRISLGIEKQKAPDIDFDQLAKILIRIKESPTLTYRLQAAIVEEIERA